ncbi:MAG: polysaccharide biosynthesis/export family protein [Puniceicoccales bacterium]|jgi:polysaccharide export outer membrane protein|nr:polysaccharide biosynthesis/export family protein [Puniceicoccales bacterium]
MKHFSLLKALPLFALALSLTGCRTVVDGATELGQTIGVLERDPTKWPSNYPPQEPIATTENYRLHPLDVIQIEFFQDIEVNSRQVIGPDGYVNMKLLDRVKLVDMTCDEVKAFLTEKYKKYYRNPQISVHIVGYAGKNVLFHGTISNGPAALFMEGRVLHLSEAIAARGGIPARGNKNSVKLTRRFEVRDENGVIKKNPDGTDKVRVETFTIDVGLIEEGKAPDIPLKDGDRIFVPESLI